MGGGDGEGSRGAGPFVLRVFVSLRAFVIQTFLPPTSPVSRGGAGLLFALAA